MEDNLFYKVQIRNLQDGKIIVKDYYVGHMELGSTIFWKCKAVVPIHVAKLIQMTAGFHPAKFGFDGYGTTDTETLWESSKDAH